MATSLFPKSESVERNVAKVSAAAGGTTSRVVLNKDSLISEHSLLVSVAQSFAGAPTSVEPGRFIKSISIETDNGTIVRAAGTSLYELMRFTETGSKEVSTLAANSTARFMIDLHYELDGAKRDLATAIEASVLSTFDLVIEWASDSDNGFLGGTTPAAASYDVEVISRDYPDLQHIGDSEVDAEGNDNPHFGVAQFVHFSEEQVKNGSTAGALEAFRMIVGNSTRFIALVAEDTTGGAYVGRRDDIVTDIKLIIGGQERRKVSWNYVRHENTSSRSFDHVGVAILDWGDDEVGFLNLEDEAEALLEVTTALPTGVTAFRIRALQDYVR